MLRIPRTLYCKVFDDDPQRNRRRPEPPERPETGAPRDRSPQNADLSTVPPPYPSLPSFIPIAISVTHEENLGPIVTVVGDLCFYMAFSEYDLAPHVQVLLCSIDMA